MIDYEVTENTPMAFYGPDGPAVIRVCSQCGRFIKAPKELVWNNEWPYIKTKGHCKKCGEIELMWDGWGSDWGIEDN